MQVDGSSPVRVLAFSDEHLQQFALQHYLSGSPGVQLLGIARSSDELLTAAAQLRPDLVLVDLIPDLSLSIIRELRHILPSGSLVLWVRSISTELAHHALDLGVRGIILKTLPPEVLLQALGAVAAGELWLDKALTRDLLTARPIPLTRRESQLVELLSHGLKNKEIATALSISEGTVKVYLSRLFDKVGAKDRLELALYGLRNSRVAAVTSGAMRSRSNGVEEFRSIVVRPVA